MKSNTPRRNISPSRKIPVTDDTVAKLNLYRQVASCLVNEDKYYQSGRNAHADLISAIDSVTDTEWILKLALYARKDLHLRSVPVVLTSEVAMSGREKNGMRKYVSAVVQRADEIPEFLAYTKQRCMEQGRSKLPQMILKGLRPAWQKFNPYQLNKYKMSDKAFTLRDAMFLTHPHPTDVEVYNKIANGTLTTTEDTATWENYISTHGSTAATWEHIIPKMGYMALMRNLNNFIKTGISPVSRNYVCDYLKNEKNVLKSKQLPFRFYSAYRNLMKEGHVAPYLTAISDAMDISCGNIPKLPGDTIVMVDTSGSMTCSTVSGNSTMRPVDVAMLMGCMLKHANPNTTVIGFDSNAKYLNPLGKSVLQDTDNLISKVNGGATHLYRALDLVTKDKVSASRIIVLSDMQTYGGSEMEAFNRYKARVNPKTKMYLIDLAGYSKFKFPVDDSDVFIMSGFSDRIFSLIEMFETDPQAAITAIDNISI